MTTHPDLLALAADRQLEEDRHRARVRALVRSARRPRPGLPTGLGRRLAVGSDAIRPAAPAIRCEPAIAGCRSC